MLHDECNIPSLTGIPALNPEQDWNCRDCPREALIKFHMRDRGDSGRGQDGEDAV